MSELKPCPFCGEKPELYIDEVDLNGSATADYFSYYCDGCDFSRGEFLHIEKAKESWNSRAESTLTEETNRLLNLECEELKGSIESIKSEIYELSEMVVLPALELAKLDYLNSPNAVMDMDNWQRFISNIKEDK